MIKNNKSKQPQDYYGLDTRKIALVSLGTHSSIHGALQRRNTEARSYNRIISHGELQGFKKIVANAKSGQYYYLNSDAQLVEMGTFKNDAEARQHALVKLFGIQKLMVVDGARLRKAIDKLTKELATPAPAVAEEPAAVTA